MKKSSTLCFFAFLLVINLQTLGAQTIHSINTSSLEKVRKLQTQVKFNDTQFKKIHQAYVEYDGRIASLNSLAKSKSGNKFGNREHLLKIKLQKTIKRILNDDETVFKYYLRATDQQNFTKLVEKPEHSKTVNLIDRNPSRSSIKMRSRPTKTFILKEKRN